jgi:hypothetical protein
MLLGNTAGLSLFYNYFRKGTWLHKQV